MGGWSGSGEGGGQEIKEERVCHREKKRERGRSLVDWPELMHKTYFNTCHPTA